MISVLILVPHNPAFCGPAVRPSDLIEPPEINFVLQWRSFHPLKSSPLLVCHNDYQCPFMNLVYPAFP